MSVHSAIGYRGYVIRLANQNIKVATVFSRMNKFLAWHQENKTV